MPQNVNIKATMQTPATGDILRIANAAGASANYIIEIAGF